MCSTCNFYVLRGDHQRAVARNQELAVALDAAESPRSSVTADELSLLYAKLAGRMTLLSSEIARLVPPSVGGGMASALYLDLLERALTGLLVEDTSIAP